MDSLDFVKILGTGIAGFGFLLMYLAYKLIASLVTLPKVNPAILKMINRYMLVCFIMTVTVGVFTFMSTSYKNDLISNQEAVIKSKDTALNILTTSQKNKLLADSVSKAGDSQTIAEVHSRQSGYLDTLQKYIESQHNPTQRDRFNRYKNSISTIADSLTMSNVDHRRREFLKEKYVTLNDSISRLSLKVVDNQVPIIKN